jgi:hypothetical protein
VIVSRHALHGYVLVLLATLCGVAGMGLVFTGATEGKPADLTVGLPLLFLGLWWSGIQLGRSQAAGRARRAARLRARTLDGSSR